MIQRDRLVQHLLDLIRIDSPSRKERKVALRLKNDLETMGANVVFDKAGEKINGSIGNLVAHFKGSGQKASPFLLSAHMDTVQPGEGIKPRIDEDTIRTDGTTVLGGDDKSGIAIVCEAIRSLQEENIPHGDLELVFTICEEDGLQGAKNLDISLLKSRFGLVFDSDAAGILFTKAPASDRMEFTVHGLEAHAGMCPERGLNAIQIASEAIANMRLGRLDEDTTANIGVIQGGLAPNIVAKQVFIKAEARSHSNEKLSAQTKHMRKCLQDAVGRHSVVVDGITHISRLEEKVWRDYERIDIQDDSPIVQLVLNAAHNLGQNIETRKMGGGCDASALNQRGFQVANLGTGMHDIHTVNEWLDIPEMCRTASIVEEILKLHAKG
ncbi:MAG TPA: M20/M25/M40 family metallo-hydrolase [Nitrospiria bacterium]|jgi:tripeptide aminopeptidase